MENEKKSGRIKWLFLTPVPAIGMLLAMIMAMIPVMFIKIFQIMNEVGIGADYMDRVNALTKDSDFLLASSMAGEAVGIVAGYLIYYLVFKMKRLENPAKVFNFKGFAGIVLMFIGVEMACGVYLNILWVVAPKMAANYAKLMETSGLTDLSLISTIATVVIAPVCEEVFFRGMTLNIAGRFTKRFWIANFLQALFFGIEHANFVQGSYAFAMGLVLGYIYKRFNSLYASILAHLVFNITGTWLVAVIFGASEENTPLGRLVIVTVISIIFIIGAIVMIKKNNKCDEREKAYMARVHGVYEEEPVSI